jgi:glutathione S-transferase
LDEWIEDLGYGGSMDELILHHYDLSPFAEKIRLALGLKGLAWRSVDVPMVLPKPDHFELTGGYRRVPVLQTGADIYCDTHLITRVLDRLHPTRPLAPPGLETIEHAVSRWSETSFMMVILAYFGIGGVFDEEFVEDRRKTMVAPGTDLDAAAKILPTKLVQLADNIRRLDAMLADGRPFLLGEAACAADLSAYHPLMMLGLHQKTQALLEGEDRVNAWLERVRAIGHGERSTLDASAAIEIASQAQPATYEGDPVLPEGMKLGDPVIVLHDDYGSGNVTGTLAASGLDEIAVRREGERVGEVVVHFPREDYTVIALG